MKGNQFMELDILGFTEERGWWTADEPPVLELDLPPTEGNKNCERKFLPQKGTGLETRERA